MGWGEPLDRFLGGVIFPVVTKQDQQAGSYPSHWARVRQQGQAAEISEGNQANVISE